MSFTMYACKASTNQCMHLCIDICTDIALNDNIWHDVDWIVSEIKAGAESERKLVLLSSPLPFQRSMENNQIVSLIRHDRYWYLDHINLNPAQQTHSLLWFHDSFHINHYTQQPTSHQQMACVWTFHYDTWGHHTISVATQADAQLAGVRSDVAGI